MKKKVIIGIIVVLLIGAFVTGAFVIWKDKKVKESEGLCYVESVSVITGNGMTWNNRYMGIVETQEVTKVQKDSEKVIKEIYVEEEDTVKAGDKLFSYDTDEMTLKLRQLELELTSYYNNISTMYDQIETLTAERELAPAEQKIEYTSQIQNLQAQINQASYDASAKQLEIDRQNTAINNSIVYAPVDGVISSINNQDTSSDPYAYDYYGDMGGDSDAFISIMAMGDFRVKGTVSELNAYSLSEGMPVLVRSRVDENIIWTGTISKVDLEHPVGNDNMYYYSPGETATKYPFYVQVDSSEGMMLGQHLYIELDFGQGVTKDGMWLYEEYVILDGATAYVWAENKDGRLEKRQVSLGDYDEEMMMYEIKSGISNSDYIAFPEEGLEEGMKTTRSIEEYMESEGFDDGMNMDGDIIEEDIFMEDGVIQDEIYMEDGMPEDGMLEEDMYIEDGVIEDGVIEENIPDDSMEDIDVQLEKPVGYNNSGYVALCEEA
ncbi:MAG: efflux RND transporter periplasmic adaptor subunit [Lachnospiraceae bacterium]|nr:efflux RND transporter periplasmic adaptor subunit [Lachnospiraceae bacterium]